MRDPVPRGRPAVRMLHTSDLHIVDGHDPAKVLRRVADVAAERAADIVLIAGDLFDHARIADETASAAIAGLARFSQPVVVIPGNHDCVDEQSVYRRVDLTLAGSHLHFAGHPDGQELRFDDLSLHVWARGIEHHHPAYRPLAGRRPAPPGDWSVVMAHGFYARNPEDLLRSSPIQPTEIAALGCDYLALGHIHRFLDVSEGDVRAFYSGSPSDPAAGTGTVNLVTLDPQSGVRVVREPVAGDSARLSPTA